MGRVIQGWALVNFSYLQGGCLLGLPELCADVKSHNSALSA